MSVELGVWNCSVPSGQNKNSIQHEPKDIAENVMKKYLFLILSPEAIP